MPSFSHLDPGTDESVWAADPRLGSVARFDEDVAHLFVLAAHPDDETLGAAGLMRRVHERNGHVTVIIATDGEGSHPRSQTHTPAQLRAVRRVEVRQAVALVAPRAHLHFLGLPDGGLGDSLGELTSAVLAIVDTPAAPGEAEPGDVPGGHMTRRRSHEMIVAPWSGDGHRDHRIAAEAAASVAVARGLRHVGYPIWLWHWGAPDDLPWGSARGLALTPDERSAKVAAISMHASQIAPLSSGEGDEPIVHDGMRAHFDRAVEVYLDESPAADSTLRPAFFDDFYARNDDPWGFETRWYERRKRMILTSALPNDRLGRVLEIGCSTGLVTAQLAARADSVWAIDAAAAAVDAARARLGDHPHVTIHKGSVPHDWPDGTFDTIVLSEVGYYLSVADLQTLIRRAVAALAPDGCLIACHWRHEVTEYPQTGDAVHDALRQTPEWDVLVRHEEADFLIEVFCPSPARSVAAREGLA